VSPVVTSDTTYVLPIPNTNEYFMLENRQRIGSDSMIYEEGLLIWHVDSYLAGLRGPAPNSTNYMNVPYAVALEQADGRDDLGDGVNRGDDGDPFPGTSNNHSFGRNTSPPSHSNYGLLSTVELDSIDQLESFGAIRLKIGFQAPAVIAATDTNAVFRLNGVEYNRFDDFLTSGTDYALVMDSLQYADTNRRRFEWVSWSNGKPRSHTFTASSAGDTITATVAAEYRLSATMTGTGSGSIAPDVSLDLENGTFLRPDSIVTLVAVTDSAGHIFEGWDGSDTTATADTLILRMSRPFSLEAVFAAPLLVATDSLPTPTMGTDYSHQLTVTGGIGGNTWALASGTLPTGLTLSATGLLSGLPEQTGSFALGVSVSSGSQSVVDTLQLTVIAPVLAVSDILQQLVGAGTPLSDEDLVYLDLLGNGNSWLDVGDFLGWVESTGAAVTMQEMAVLRKVTSASRGEGRRP
jgi:hypothetical protein